ncbi:MAG: protein kinase domain-containing protein [Synechocystis sp.]
MPRIFCSKTHQAIALHQKIASSGEGEVWTTDNPRQLAKIYHQPTNQRQHKLLTMIDYPPKMSSNQNFISYAWPKSLLLNDPPHSGSLRDRQIVGFLMPRITGGRELIDLYNASRRKRLGIKVNWHFLHVTAHNLASIIETLHEQGIVLGDIKPQNILINNQAIPAIIDTDSFQIKNPSTGSLYRCLVGSEGFTPPELLGQDFSLVTQSPLHDRFRLGVIIYYLLFGSHPFQGRWVGQGDPPEQHQLIKQGQWVFAPGSSLKPSKLTIPLTIIHPALQICFWRCFQEGHRNPSQRPSAKEWQRVLAEAATELKQCSVVKSHVYSAQEASCYWCDRQTNLKTDIFDHSVVPAAPPKPISPLSLPVIPVPPLPAKNPVPSRLFVPVKRGNTYRFQLAFLPSVLFFSAGVMITAAMVSVAAWLSTPSFPSPKQIAQSTFPIVRSSPLPEPQPTPQTAAILLRSGYINYIQGDAAQALNDLNQALTLEPSLAEAYYYRSLAQKTLGYQQEAEWDWHLAQRLAPEKMPFNPMFSSLDLALPLDPLSKERYPNPDEVTPSDVSPTTDPSPPSIVPSPTPVPSAEDRLIKLQIEQINQDIEQLKLDINQEPTNPPPKKSGDWSQP